MIPKVTVAKKKKKKEGEEGKLDSFLIKITSNILKYKDKKRFLLERIRDTAGQKRTGK